MPARWILAFGSPSWFLTGNLLVRVTGGRLALGTFLRYDRIPGHVLWPALSAVHRRLAPGLLRDAEAKMRTHRPGAAGRSQRAGHAGALREMIGTFCSDADEVEARSMLAFCVAIGEHFLAADHGGRTRGEVLARAADLLLDRRHDNG
ncbi:hypothetical protein [Nonomuraea diastatica]|uniref:hypothetical protein n=1 Tax=Nonomuraea diastatica TaxID=1848329 RepID=UPI001FE634B6|nr:hypothetical protein [Nonomuraea diastatica]